MYELGNKLAPVLHLGEELSGSTPPPTGPEASGNGKTDGEERASVSMESEDTTETSSDKTTPLL